jgi:hypothetical protein
MSDDISEEPERGGILESLQLQTVDENYLKKLGDMPPVYFEMKPKSVLIMSQEDRVSGYISFLNKSTEELQKKGTEMGIARIKVKLSILMGEESQHAQKYELQNSSGERVTEPEKLENSERVYYTTPGLSSSSMDAFTFSKTCSLHILTYFEHNYLKYFSNGELKCLQTRAEVNDFLNKDHVDDEKMLFY